MWGKGKISLGIWMLGAVLLTRVLGTSCSSTAG